jgi:hypothetical protein
MLKIHDLLCRFCGTKTGEIELPDWKKFEDADIEDVRCDECQKTHGTVQELFERFEKEANNKRSNEEFKAIMKKAGWKKGKKFDDEIAKIKPVDPQT